MGAIYFVLSCHNAGLTHCGQQPLLQQNLACIAWHYQLSSGAVRLPLCRRSRVGQTIMPQAILPPWYSCTRRAYLFTGITSYPVRKLCGIAGVIHVHHKRSSRRSFSHLTCCKEQQIAPVGRRHAAQACPEPRFNPLLWFAPCCRCQPGTRIPFLVDMQGWWTGSSAWFASPTGYTRRC